MSVFISRVPLVVASFDLPDLLGGLVDALDLSTRGRFSKTSSDSGQEGSLGRLVSEASRGSGLDSSTGRDRKLRLTWEVASASFSRPFILFDGGGVSSRWFGGGVLRVEALTGAGGVTFFGDVIGDVVVFGGVTGGVVFFGDVTGDVVFFGDIAGGVVFFGERAGGVAFLGDVIGDLVFFGEVAGGVAFLGDVAGGMVFLGKEIRGVAFIGDMSAVEDAVAGGGVLVCDEGGGDLLEGAV